MHAVSGALLIFFLRILDVPVGTLRVMYMVRGDRRRAVPLAFVESFDWLFAISRVMKNVDNPVNMLAFAAGFVAGQRPMKDGKLLATGQVPSRCPIDTAKAAARQCVINGLAAVRTVEPDLGRIAGVVRVGAFVSSDSNFTEQPKVANGASE